MKRAFGFLFWVYKWCGPRLGLDHSRRSHGFPRNAPTARRHHSSPHGIRSSSQRSESDHSPFDAPSNPIGPPPGPWRRPVPSPGRLGWPLTLTPTSTLTLTLTRKQSRSCGECVRSDAPPPQFKPPRNPRCGKSKTNEIDQNPQPREGSGLQAVSGHYFFKQSTKKEFLDHAFLLEHDGEKIPQIFCSEGSRE